ncbi:probable beta-1,3 exoglucanase precursor [Ustilago trichophora]|uniref:Probable beta-1,3 exoglucanase n=1 Tax=Ustilago trichophora TaxID=86804 RepID=A0A5C3DV89_9BASI|nr:probable beta-1,3 exoglucanase precursor [Ustilago trichophora]
MLLTRRWKQPNSPRTTAVDPASCILLLLAACGLVACAASSDSQANAQNSPALVGHSIDAVNWAASASYHQQDSDSAIQLDTPGSDSSTSPPLPETVRRDSFPIIELDNTPSSPFANQEELALAQHTLPSVLKVTASGLTGVAEAGKSLFDGIAQVLQQSQIAWANLENAANLTRLVQESLSNRFGDQIFSSPFSLSINSSMQTESPTNPSQATASRANETFWFELIDHNGNATYNPNPSTYQVYRNVKDFGAKGDGVTDDTNAINQAISQGNRCGQGCGSSTISPAVVYFPPGTYLVSSPIVSYYYTQLMGSATDRPTLLAAPTFQGIAVIDEDPYSSDGSNWYINQNNFFRAVYNFKIDLTQMPPSSGTGIHHQVSQATGLFNVHFEMRQDADNNTQQGIFMENGSGGFMTNLSFRGGRYGAYLGNQQFTVRNTSFENCQTAISQAWNWGWSYHDIHVTNCTLGLEMRTSPNPASGSQGAASILAYDWTLCNVDTAFNITTPDSGTLILDNIAVENIGAVVRSGNAVDEPILLVGSEEPSVIQSWVQGSTVEGKQLLEDVQSVSTIDIQRPSSLVKMDNPLQPWFSRSRPQYEWANVSEFVNVKDLGCAGDGKTDDSKALQKILNDSAGKKIVFVPQGTYYLESTVTFPPGTKMVGEVWPVLMGGGPLFQNASDPRPVVRIGCPGDSGIMEISDMIFSTRGPAPGAIIIEWNIREQEGTQGSAAIWDSHIRVGGFAGTNLEADRCAREQPLSDACRASFLNLHLTPNSSAYIENMWVWVADHDLDYGDRAQVNLLSGRGVLIESAQGPVWMYGGASEHAVLYQYNIVNADNIFISLAQTETAYFQGTGRAVASAEEPLSIATYHDPNFNLSSSASSSSPFSNPDDPYENRGLGMRIANSTNVFIYGAGLYSFFTNYDQSQVSARRSQKRILWLQDLDQEANVWVLNLNTVGVEKMVTVDGTDTVDEGGLRNGFGNTLAVWASQL